MRITEIIKIKQVLIQFKWNSEIVEDLIDALQNYKAVWEYQCLEFNANKVKQYEEIRKNLARKYKARAFFGIETYQKDHMRVFLQIKTK